MGNTVKKITVTVEETPNGNKIFQLTLEGEVSGAELIEAGELIMDEVDNM